jgi:hypothetical protein
MTVTRLCHGLLSLLLMAMLLGLACNTAAASCLTKPEARKLWPREHIYWHTEAHCWDASRRSEHNARTHPVAASAVRPPELAADNPSPSPPPRVVDKVQPPPIVALSGEEPPPYAWLDALSWLPILWHSFESKWDEEVGQLGQSHTKGRFGPSSR